jgi:hypothetical protein
MKEPTFDELREWFPWATESDLNMILDQKLYLCAENGRIFLYLYDKDLEVRSEQGMRKRARSQLYRFGEKKLKAMEQLRANGEAEQLNIFR